MKSIALALSSLVSTSSEAIAADEMQPLGFDWSGAYIGVHLGGGLLNGDMTAYTHYN